MDNNGLLFPHGPFKKQIITVHIYASPSRHSAAFGVKNIFYEILPYHYRMPVTGIMWNYKRVLARRRSQKQEGRMKYLLLLLLTSCTFKYQWQAQKAVVYDRHGYNFKLCAIGYPKPVDSTTIPKCDTVIMLIKKRVK